MHDKFYYEIPTKSGINADEIIRKYSKSHWGEYYLFKATKLPDEYLKADSFIEWLSNKYEMELILFYYPPYYVYNWHVDIRRGITLNLLLNFDGDSHCIFTNELDHTKKVFYINELVYKPNTYYLFNAQAYHSIYNFNKARYLIGCEFKQKKDTLTYDMIKNSVIEYYANNQKG